ncbi:MAG: response regulator transcription factor, partial [Bacteroidota bacterium]
MIRVLIADDHPAFRSGLAAFLDAEPDVEIIGEAKNGAEALQFAVKNRPDVLVLDLEMPGLSGIEVTERIRDQAPDVNVLILSAYEDQDYIFGVLDHGAAGYLTKQEPLDVTLDAIRGVAKGETGWLSRRISALFVGARRQAPDRDRLLGDLSTREQEVLAELAHGRSNAEIADRLFVSTSTIKKHMNSVFEKLGLRTRAQAVAWMWRHGLVE